MNPNDLSTQFSLVRGPKDYSPVTHTGVSPRDFTKITARRGKHPIGEMYLAEFSPGVHYVDNVTVDPEHQGTGVASAMWRFTERILPHDKFIHDPEDMSDEGYALAKSRVKANPRQHIMDEEDGDDWD